MNFNLLEINLPLKGIPARLAVIIGTNSSDYDEYLIKNGLQNKPDLHHAELKDNEFSKICWGLGGGSILLVKGIWEDLNEKNKLFASISYMTDHLINCQYDIEYFLQRPTLRTYLDTMVTIDITHKVLQALANHHFDKFIQD